MPQDHQITCIIPDSADADRRIDSIGGSSGGTDGGGWCIKLDVAIKGIEDGTWRFWTSANGKSVWVIIAKRNVPQNRGGRRRAQQPSESARVQIAVKAPSPDRYRVRAALPAQAEATANPLP
jgi:hypothetical protein